MEYGEMLPWMRDLAAEGDILDSYRKKPKLEPHLVFYWNAFWELHTDRPEGFAGLKPIPSMALRDFQNEHSMKGEDRKRFRLIVRAMEDAYLSYAEKLRENLEKNKDGDRK